MSKKIADNPGYLQLDEEIRGIQYLERICPFLFTKEQRDQIANIRTCLDEQRTRPDEFNSLFVNRGWVCYETMNSDLLVRCIELGKDGDYEGAEQELVSFYQRDIRYLVSLLRHTPGFSSRFELFEKALDDYHNGGYHSCTPLFLMLIDGAVNEVLKKNQGLFAQNIDLVIDGSVVGHETGLPSLVKILSRSRKQTTTEAISMPYRNGIMHGMDLGYDNVLVATKALALLFAVAEWIRQYGKPKQEPKSNKIGLKQTIASYAQIMNRLKAQQRLIDAWTPRCFDSVDFATYIPEPGSPEQRVCELFDFYVKSNYGRMAELLADCLHYSVKKEASHVRSLLENIKCIKYHLLRVVDRAPAVTEVIARLTVDLLNGIQKVIDVKSRVIYQASRDSHSVMCRLEDGGQWFILDGVLNEIVNQASRR